LPAISTLIHVKKPRLSINLDSCNPLMKIIDADGPHSNLHLTLTCFQSPFSSKESRSTHTSQFSGLRTVFPSRCTSSLRPSRSGKSSHERFIKCVGPNRKKLQNYESTENQRASPVYEPIALLNNQAKTDQSQCSGLA
jgi:hypothetical protein